MIRLLSNRRGAVAPLVALCMIPVLLSAGVAIDFTRLTLLRMRLQQSVDAASLVGAREIGSSTQIADAQAIFWANYSRNPPGAGAGFLGSTSSGANVTQVDATHVQVNAQANLPLTLMRLGGVSSLWAASTTAVAAKTTTYEIALVLDNTASMLECANGTQTQGCTTKEQALQTAANNMLNILYPNGADTVPNQSISVIPFGDTVNMGTGYQSWLGSYNASNWTAQAWRGCVMARTGGYDVTEDNPGTSSFTTLYWPSTSGVGSSGKGDNDWTANDITDNGNAVTSYSQVSSYSYLAHGPNLGCTNAPIIPLTASKSTIENTISELAGECWPGTIIAQGLQWAWFTLSPLWQNYWNLAASPSGAARPLAYGTPGNYKVVILMTDGNDEWDGNELSTGFNPGCQKYNVYPECQQVDGYLTAYGRLSQNRLGIAMPTAASSSQTDEGTASNNASNSAVTALDNKTSSVCTAMKNENIIVYTIAFEAAAGSPAATLLQGCATDSAHYYDTQTGNDINAAFQSIGHQLANLRLTQ